MNTMKKHAHWIVLAIFIVLMLVACRFVNLSGDDFAYSAFNGTNDAASFFSFLRNHYLRTNGRVAVYSLLILMLKLNLNVWRTAQPFLLGALLLLAAKFTSNGDKRTFKVALITGCAVLLALGKELAGETTLWVTGSFNFVYPAFLMFLNAHFTNKTYETGNQYKILPVLGFAGGGNDGTIRYDVGGICDFDSVGVFYKGKKETQGDPLRERARRFGRISHGCAGSGKSCKNGFRQLYETIGRKFCGGAYHVLQHESSFGGVVNTPYDSKLLAYNL